MHQPTQLIAKMSLKISRYQMIMQTQIVKLTQQLLNQTPLRITVFLKHFYH
jgi:hypothetical protein